jgi:3-isopropylmalate/(R)-2-methylmalate dehydratase large subunit
LLDKVWDSHLVGSASGHRDVSPVDRLRVDRILLHEHQVGLVGRAGNDGLAIAAPERIVACADQQVPTTPSADEPRPGAQLAATVERLEHTSVRLGLPLFGLGDHRGGVVNVVAAEQGMVLPGDFVVGADSHVATQGALGALALVLADDEVAATVATGEVERERPTSMRVTVSGSLDAAASAKDLALWLLGRLGPGLAGGSVLELGGPLVRSLSVEGRMTLCNLAVESGAESVIISVDRLVEQYLDGRPFAPSGAERRSAFDTWRRLGSDPGSEFAADLVCMGERIGPQVTWGTDVSQVVDLDGTIPEPDSRDQRRAALDERALAEQGLVPGQAVGSIEVEQVFIGSCANARIEDLRAAADVIRGGRAQVRSWVVPGSWPVKRQAEAEGLHRVFRDAGFEWRDPGCSLCIGANGDAVRNGDRLASTANRPVRGLVGPGSRVHLLSPASAAATALVGRLAAPGATI